MRVCTGLRRVSAAGAIIILVAWSVVPLGEFVREAFAKAEEPTPASVTAIEVSARERNACRHHPAGCPRDCFCPKTSIAGEDAEEASGSPGSAAPFRPSNVSAPALTQCTEDIAKQGEPVTALILPSLPCEFSLFEGASALISAMRPVPVDRSPDLPLKIPIA